MARPSGNKINCFPRNSTMLGPFAQGFRRFHVVVMQRTCRAFVLLINPIVFYVFVVVVIVV